MIQRETVSREGRTVIHEHRYHGLLREDGSFRLLACCGKRFHLPREQIKQPECMAGHQKTAA